MHLYQAEGGGGRGGCIPSKFKYRLLSLVLSAVKRLQTFDKIT